MRRTRVPLTAWPAFADLMTILAIAGLAAAVVIVTTETGTGGDLEVLRQVIAALKEENATLRKAIDARDTRIASLQDDVHNLQEEVGNLETTIRFGARPCLGIRDGQPRTLLRIVVNAGYRLEPRWLTEVDGAVANVPGLSDALTQGQLTPSVFEGYAEAIYRHGVAENTFGGSCRFFVELQKDTDSYRRFSQAVGVVSRYYLIANSSDVNRILAAG